MHICLVTNTNYLSDPKSRAYVQQLQGVGHQVSVVGIGTDQRTPPWLHLFADEVQPTPRKLTLWARRGKGARTPVRNRSQLLIEEAVNIGADLYVALNQRVWPMAASAAKTVGVPVVQPPGVGDPDASTLVQRVPLEPHLSSPVAGLGTGHTPGQPPVPRDPLPNRLEGKRVAVCYRKTNRSPGRYLEEALIRAGVKVELRTESVNLDELDGIVDFILFVESPNPPLEVVGQASTTPVLYWIHHGEHHLAANTRLTRRFGADGVLLAHSWHLAHHFDVPVHRFPFGAAITEFDPLRSHAKRRFDVALVGARLFGDQGPYGARQESIARLLDHFPNERLAFRENIAPEEMADIYGCSKIILNDGGTRHFPITMRVLEAVAAGALLLSEAAPGMELLLEKETHYATQSGDIVQDVQKLLADPISTEYRAQAALNHVRHRHSYDHRVDELFAVASLTTKANRRPPQRISNLASCIDLDPSVQRVAQFGAPHLAKELPTREIAALAELPPGALAARRMEAVALSTDTPEDHLELLRAARRYIYYEGQSDLLTRFTSQERPTAVVSSINEVVRVDLQAGGYTISPSADKS